MGMFDNVRCAVPLPDGWEPTAPLQTKDLESTLASYLITEDRTLERHEYELKPDGDPMQHPVIKSWDDWQPMKRVNERYERVMHHGDINFYGGEKDGEEITPQGFSRPKFIWHEYVARFSNGVLIGLVTAENRDQLGMADPLKLLDPGEKLVRALYNELELWRSFVTENPAGTPRYTFQEGAGLNAMIKGTDQLLARAKRSLQIDE